MTLVAITTRTMNIPERMETRDELDQRWYSFFDLCGLIPITLPNHLATTKKLVNTLSINLILLSGGNSSDERQQNESFLIRHAIDTKTPLLGVCHGMQALQQHFHHPLEKVSGHVTEKQLIFINNAQRIVNSYHELGARVASSEFDIWAKADDGVIKAIKHKNLPLIGLMWHPERLTPFHQDDINLCVSLAKGEMTCAG